MGRASPILFQLSDDEETNSPSTSLDVSKWIDASSSPQKVIEVSNDEDDVKFIGRDSNYRRIAKRREEGFYISPKKAKVEVDLDALVRPRTTPTDLRSLKKNSISRKRNVLDQHIDLKPEPGQLTIDAHLAWKDGRKTEANFACKPATEKSVPKVVRNVTPPPSLKAEPAGITTPPQMKYCGPCTTVTPPSVKLNQSSEADDVFGTWKTPSPARVKNAPPSLSKFEASLNSPSFKLKKNSAAMITLEEVKAKAIHNPKCRMSRSMMTGYECDCCKDLYDQLGLEGEERRAYVDKVSKHRGFMPLQSTPPRYWDIEAPSKEEQIALGYVIPTDSPLFKKRGK